MSRRLLVILLVLAVAVGVLPVASAADSVAAASSLQIDDAVGGEGVAGEDDDDDVDPIDVKDPQPPSESTLRESEPEPSGRVRTGPHTADEREIETNNLRPVSEIVPGESKVVDIPVKGSRAAFADTPLRVVVDKTGFADEPSPRARLEVNDSFAAPQGALTSLFRVDLEDAEGRAFAHEKPLQLELDFTEYASTLQANLAGRLQLTYYDGCRQVEQEDVDTKTSEIVTVCDVVVPLDTTRNDSSKVLTATLDPTATSDRGVPVGPGLGSQQLDSGDGWYGYQGGATDDTGTFVVTPFANVADYQVALFTGAFTTSYPIAVPPSPAGPVPSVTLSYSSGAVDGMRADKNNQPGPIGTGWSLGAGGSITRHFETTCTNGSNPIYDACPIDKEFSLTLNGVGSRLVHVSGGEYRLESDPMWRIEMKTDGTVAKESHDEYWVVTTPDGTRYEFGATDDSLDHVPMYTFGLTGPSCEGLEDDAWRASHVCYKAWRWNLNKVTDTFGNTMLFDYRQEFDYYGVRTYPSDKGQVVRASHVARIRYADIDSSSATDFKARVLFDYEVRCKNPESVTNCDDDNELVDTPVDQACRKSDSSCTNDHPSYFSELALDGVRTQVQRGSSWETVGWWDLDQSYPQNNGPTSTEEASPAKLWLNSVTQRPASSGKRPAFMQIEAEDWDSKTGSVGTRISSDWGVGKDVKWIHDGESLKFNDVDLGDGVDDILIRYSSQLQDGEFHIFFDSISGSPDVVVPVDDTLTDWNEYVTEKVAITGSPTGVHDVFIYIHNPGTTVQLAYFNWFRFTSDSELDGLNPTEFEEATEPGGFYHKNRAESLSALKAIPRPPIRLPRIGKIVTTLQGQVDVEYGQDWGWDSEAAPPQGDCRQDYDDRHKGPQCDYFSSWYDGFRVHFNIWKVKEVLSYDAFSENQTNTVAYTYSRPGWAFTDTPGYLDDSHCNEGPCNTYADFRGHETVTVWRGTAADGNLGKEEHVFFQGLDGANTTHYPDPKTVNRSSGTDPVDEDRFTGRETEIKTWDDSDWVTRTLTDYYSDATVTGEAYFVAPFAINTTWNQSGSNPKSTVTYDYDAYGNLTEEKHLLDPDVDDEAGERNIERNYVYNTTDWIVAAPKNQTLWAGEDHGTNSTVDELSFTKFYYEDDHSYGDPPDTGAVTRVEAFSKRIGADVSSETDYEYDSMGRVTKVTDPLNREVETHYSSTTGFADWVDNAKNHQTELETEVAYGAPTKITDPNGNVTEVEYDEYGRTSKVWLPTESSSGSESLEFNYTLATATSPAMTESRQLAETTPSDVYLESYDFYDGFGRVVQSQSAAKDSGYRIVTSRYYSSRGVLRRESGPHRQSEEAGFDYYDDETWTGASPTMSLQTVYTVDDLDRVTLTETIADDSAPNKIWDESMSYDGLNQTATDRMGIELDYEYDTFGNLVAVTEYDDGDIGEVSTPSVYTTQYQYDQSNRLTTVLNSQDQTGPADDIVITYDLLGHKTAMSDPDMGDWSYVYDLAGNLTSQTDGRDDTVVFTYDALNRPLYQYDTSTSGDKIARWDYDKSGEKGLLNWSRSYENDVERVLVNPLGYDARGRVTSTKWTVSGQGAGNWTVSQTYDPADRVESLTYPDGETLTYGYLDRTGHPESLVTDDHDDAIVLSASFNAQGQPDQQEWGEGAAQNMFVKFNYTDDSQRLFRIKVDDDTYGQDLIGHFRYHYDLNGNITQFKDKKNGAQVQCFSYDDLGRLKRGFISDDDSGTSDDCSDGYTTTGAGWYDRSYDYDPLGNIDSWTNEVNETTQNYTYAQTGNAGPHAATALGGVGSYTYDGNGNQATRPGATLVFDVANRLSSYTTGGNTTAFTYDVDGARVVRDEGANETIYVGGIYEDDDSSTRSYYTFAGTVVAYRLQEGATDERFYLVSDHLGTNSHQIKYSDGTRSSQYYLPFGGDRGSTAGNLDTDRGYTGQVSDAAHTGLLFYNARYYDP
ncbi:MAG: carbohydrate-binding protein, partial [bacterium]|nr:carbohydrate-binding protein [bacterium]